MELVECSENVSGVPGTVDVRYVRWNRESKHRRGIELDDWVRRRDIVFERSRAAKLRTRGASTRIVGRCCVDVTATGWLVGEGGVRREWSVEPVSACFA